MIGSPQLAAGHVQVTTPLYSFLEKIIDKKVNQVALNFFERIIDFLCTNFYSSYNQRFDFKTKTIAICPVDAKDEEDAIAEADDQKTAEKIHHFVDGAPLYDRTTTGRVEIKQEKFVDVSTGKKVDGDDRIYIDGKPVYFSSQPNVKLLFGKNYGTEEVFIADIKECPELVLIYERETTRQLKAWCVDTTQPTKKITTGGQLTIAEEEIFIARECAPQPSPQPIVVPII